MHSPTSTPTWTPTRNALPAFGMLLMGLIASGTGHAETSKDGTCRGLASYESRSYATEKGVRRRCALLRDIETGDTPISPALRDQILQELSNRHAVELEFAGTVRLPGPVIDYLLENMPEAATLVSSYTDNEYGATQVDATPGPQGFFVTNNSTFAANFTYLTSRISSSASEHMFFESGNAKVLFWTVWGNSFVRYNLQKQHKDASRYDIKVHVFTDSRLLHMVLKSGLFKYFADRMFDGILSDIEAAVGRFTDDPTPGQHLPPYFVTGLRSRLE